MSLNIKSVLVGWKLLQFFQTRNEIREKNRVIEKLTRTITKLHSDKEKESVRELEWKSKLAHVEAIVHRQYMIINALMGLLICDIIAIVFG